MEQDSHLEETANATDDDSRALEDGNKMDKMFSLINTMAKEVTDTNQRLLRVEETLHMGRATAGIDQVGEFNHVQAGSLPTIDPSQQLMDEQNLGYEPDEPLRSQFEGLPQMYKEVLRELYNETNDRGPMTAGELDEKLGKGRANISHILNMSKREGWVTKTRHEREQRFFPTEDLVTVIE